MSAQRKRQIPVSALIILDTAALGIALCIFALFHHVLPIALQNDLSKQAAFSVTASDSARDEPSPSDMEGGDFSFAGVFTDSVITTDTSYSSPDVSVSVSTIETEGSVVHVEDIYIRNLSLLRTAFAHDVYGKGQRQTVPVMAANNNAICAINGDYYGNTSNGVVIRNGFTYRSASADDICVIYLDGDMKTYPKGKFDEALANSDDVWQVWSFGPALLKNGEAITKFTSRIKPKNPRTAIGFYEPGHYCFIAVDGRSKLSSGMTLAQLSAFCESIGCIEAYNLDGGQSSVMTFDARVVNTPVNGGRKSSDIIYIERE